jgi:hypothetical protein
MNSESEQIWMLNLRKKNKNNSKAGREKGKPFLLTLKIDVGFACNYYLSFISA